MVLNPGLVRTPRGSQRERVCDNCICCGWNGGNSLLVQVCGRANRFKGSLDLFQFAHKLKHMLVLIAVFDLAKLGLLQQLLLFERTVQGRGNAAGVGPPSVGGDRD